MGINWAGGNVLLKRNTPNLHPFRILVTEKKIIYYKVEYLFK